MKRAICWTAAFVFCLVLIVVVTYITVPTRNTVATHFDTLIVLGSPPDPDGQPSSEQRERVLQAVKDFRAGQAGHIILSGGAAHSKEAEAVVMARVATADGVPAKVIVIEDRSKNTIENVYFSNKLMQEHGWKSAEIVSSPSHLARTALIMRHYNLQWCTQGSEWPPEYSIRRKGRYYIREALGTAFLRWFGFRKTALLPSV